MTTTRGEYLEALVGTTPDDIARGLDEATTEDGCYTALHAALLRVSYPGIAQVPEGNPILARVTRARVRCGLTTSEATRTAVAREAEQRLMNQRAARRAS